MGTKGELTREYANLIYKATTESDIKPKYFKKIVGAHNDEFADSGQKDAAELLSFVLDSLHEDLNWVTERAYTQFPQFSGDSSTDKEDAEESWKLHKKWNQSIIVDHFFGLMKGTSTCLKCKFSIRKFDTFFVLEVPL